MLSEHLAEAGHLIGQTNTAPEAETGERKAFADITSSVVSLVDRGHEDLNPEWALLLHRMISYLRNEARRLQVMDVAALLGHAEDVVSEFSAHTPHVPAPDVIAATSERKGGT